MTAIDIVEELKPLGKDSYKKVMLNHGVQEPFYGVSIEEMKKILFAEFGPDVNLANIAVTTIYDTEAQRVGLGTSGPLRH